MSRARAGRCEDLRLHSGDPAALERIQTLRKEGLGFDRIAARLNLKCPAFHFGRFVRHFVRTRAELCISVHLAHG
jgi:hypothetical protein